MIQPIIAALLLIGIFLIIAWLSRSMIKASGKFWAKAEELKKKLSSEEIKTKEDLETIFNNDFQELKKLSQGGPHLREVDYIYGLLKGMYIKLKSEKDE